MTWFKVDDSFHSHPKVLATSPAALGLWVVAGAWCGANLTDGFVPDHALPRLLPDSGELAKELVSTGLWRRAKGGYRFHNWGAYNPNSTAVVKERDAARERMRKLRANRKEPGQQSNGSGEQQANVRENFGARSQPRPDPTRSSSNEELKPEQPPASRAPQGGGKTRGTRLPDIFPVTEEMAAWAREKAPSCGVDDHESFCDYWRGMPGAKGLKANWVATWRNWMRREDKTRGRPQNGNSNGRRRSTKDDAFAQHQELRAELFGVGTSPPTLVRGELT